MNEHWVVGFTGTRAGATSEQMTYLRSFLTRYDVTEFHHGDCVGADAQAHDVAKNVGIKVVIHPPTNEKYRGFCESDNILPAQGYLDRNHAIVDAVDVLVAAPKQDEEIRRSGTWATIRYARKVLVPVYIVLPGGQIQGIC